jgi:hypothetical protein
VVQVKYGVPWVGYETFSPLVYEQAQKLQYPEAIASQATTSVMVADPASGSCVMVRETTSDELNVPGYDHVKPMAIAYDASSSLIVADADKVWKVTNESATALMNNLHKPQGVAVYSDNIYVSDTEMHQILKRDAQGQVTVLAGNGSAGFADGTAAQFNNPTRLAVAEDGTVYVADTGNNRIRKIALDGTVSTVAGTGVAGLSGDGAAATAARLSAPKGIALDGRGHLYIADTGNHRVRVLRLSDGEIASLDASANPTWGEDAFNVPDISDLCVVENHLILLETSKKIWMCRLP